MARSGFETRPIYGEDPQEPTEKPRRQKVSMRMPGKLSAYVAAVQEWLLKNRSSREWKVLILQIGGSLLGAFVALLLILWFTLPNINDPATLLAAQSTVILDRNGTELYRLFSEQDRTYVPNDKISNNVKLATIAIEDERFFDRGCVDVIGFVRATLSQFFPRLLVRSGGSTLTQQFAKNAVVGRQRSIIRKIRELMLACRLEQKYNKDQLLELYLNQIPYGQNAYGIEQAARNYFSTGASALSLSRSAILAALPQRPSYFSPYGKHLRTTVSDRTLQRILDGDITESSQVSESDVQIGLVGAMVGTGSRMVYVGGRTDQVLTNMLEQKMITEADLTAALKDIQRVKFAPERENIRAPHFVLWVKNQIEEILGIDESILEKGGFRITTTLDWNLQQVAEKVVTAHRDDIRKRFGGHNAALLAIHPKTREVLAYVGNSDFSDEEHEGKIDMVRSPRQPGSSFKPFVYAAAFEAGYGPGSVVYDVETKFGENVPQNFGGDFWGLMTMRTALGGSRNIPAIKAFFLAGGEEKVLGMAERLGVPTPSVKRDEYRQTKPDFEYGYPIAIGSAEVPLLEMVQGYATLADGGQSKPLTTILKVTKDLNLLPTSKDQPEASRQVLDPRIAWELTSVLSDVDARPNNEYWKSILSVAGYQSAAKTGTSNKCLEYDLKQNCTLRRPESTWTIGYTPNLVAGVWVGNATSASLFDKADGLTTAAPLWNEFMVGAHRKIASPVAVFPVPGDIAQPLLSKLSGMLANACTPVSLRKADAVPAESTPTTEDTACVLVNVDKVTGLLASESCPADAAEQQAFFVPRSELPDRWPLWEEAVQTWAQKHMELWRATEDHSGSLLPLPLPPTEACDLTLTPGRTQKPEVTIISPLPGGEVTYPSFAPSIRIVSLSPLKSVQYLVDGRPLRTFDTAPFEGSVRVPKSIPKDGNHTFTVTVTDKYLNTVSAETTFTFGERTPMTPDS